MAQSNPPFTPPTFVNVSGNLVRPAELRFAKDGRPWASFTVAVNQGKDSQAHFYDVVAFGPLAENVASVEQGCRLVVTGRLQHRTWESPEGQKRSKVELIADEAAVSLRWATVAVTRTHRQVPTTDEPW